MIIYDPTKSKFLPKAKKRPRRLPRFKLKLPTKVVLLVFLAGAGLLGAALAVMNYSSSGGVVEDKVSSNTELSEFEKIYLTPGDEKSANAATASLVAPKAWRRERVATSPDDLIDNKNHGILEVGFNSGEANAKKQGRIIIENVTNWLEADGASSSNAFGGLTIKIDKQKAYTALNELRQIKSASQLGWDKLFRDKNEIGGAQNITYVNTADGKLGGITYVTIVSTDNSYRPHVVAYLAGSLDGVPALLRAQFAIENQTYRELYGSISAGPEAAQQAIDEFKSGKLDKDDTAMLEHVTAILKSMTIDTATRSKQ